MRWLLATFKHFFYLRKDDQFTEYFVKFCTSKFNIIIDTFCEFFHFFKWKHYDEQLRANFLLRKSEDFIIKNIILNINKLILI